MWANREMGTLYSHLISSKTKIKLNILAIKPDVFVMKTVLLNQFYL